MRNLEISLRDAKRAGELIEDRGYGLMVNRLGSECWEINMDYEWGGSWEIEEAMEEIVEMLMVNEVEIVTTFASGFVMEFVENYRLDQERIEGLEEDKKYLEEKNEKLEESKRKVEDEIYKAELNLDYYKSELGRVKEMIKWIHVEMNQDEKLIGKDVSEEEKQKAADYYGGLLMIEEGNEWGCKKLVKNWGEKVDELVEARDRYDEKIYENEIDIELIEKEIEGIK